MTLCGGLPSAVPICSPAQQALSGAICVTTPPAPPAAKPAALTFRFGCESDRVIDGNPSVTDVIVNI
jgi:hypothetical protein